MITVEEAESIIQAQVKSFGHEQVAFEQALGRVLAVDLKADRDLPPYNRVSMDGIAIAYEGFEQGCKTYRIRATQAAGDNPIEIQDSTECIEIMTGAALPASTDTVVRYEDLELKDGKATITTEAITKGQNIHYRGQDKQKDEIVARADQVITPALISVAASIGAVQLSVKKLPKVVVISTGDELVDVKWEPLPYQIRRSNSYMVKASLQSYGLEADLLHIPDNVEMIREKLQEYMEAYDVLILSGGISMGKFDFVPQVLEELAVKKLFHKVQQRPGKPFWCGVHAEKTLVFALPGNPVSTFLCLQRYVMPWLEASLGTGPKPKLFAQLASPITFNPPLQYFVQVKLSLSDTGQLLATPIKGNGSGDFANLVEADAFLELPREQSFFKNPEAYRVWPVRPLFTQ